MDFIPIQKQMVQYRECSKAYKRSELRTTLENPLLPPIEVKSFEGSPVTFKKRHGVAYLHSLTTLIWVEGAAGRLVVKVKQLLRCREDLF
jgi:hypothetical protein